MSDQAMSWAVPRTTVPLIDGKVAVEAGGMSDYAAGVGARTVEIDSGANLQHVSVIAGAAGATIRISGGDQIVLPAGMIFDQAVVGTNRGPIQIEGDVASYYVGWVRP